MIDHECTWDTLDGLTGGLSKPGKMPGPAWSIPASVCRVGSILREKAPDSPCRVCYALKGRYVFPNVIAALERRHARYIEDPAAWTAAMIGSIVKSGTAVFRWFDSGDLASVDMLKSIGTVCEQTPRVKHWLPTRERATVAAISRADRPANLVIRLSANRIGAALWPRADGPLAGLPVSVVRPKGAPVQPGQYECPAPKQGGRCGRCRACWDPSILCVSYEGH